MTFQRLFSSAVNQIKCMLVTCAILLFGFTSNAQEAKIVQFSAEQQGNGVLVKWTVGVGQTCYTVFVQRTLDTTSVFESLYLYPGICGNSQVEETYAYTDNAPVKNATSYYRLEYSGGSTTVASVLFSDFGDDGFYVLQSHANEILIRFDNPNNQRFNILLTDAVGHVASQHENYSERELTVNTSSFAKGLYIVRMSASDGTVHRGKFMLY